MGDLTWGLISRAKECSPRCLGLRRMLRTTTDLFAVPRVYNDVRDRTSVLAGFGAAWRVIYNIKPLRGLSCRARDGEEQVLSCLKVGIEGAEVGLRNSSPGSSEPRA